jgi:hypothetical protein
MKKTIFFILVGVFFALPCLAHQPYLIQNSAEVIQVSDPEISKAYYSELKGQPQYYEINSPVDFALYVNILIPAVPQTTKDMLVEVFKDNEQGSRLYVLDGKGYDWQLFFEEFARDDYYQGPEIKVPAKAGVYLIKVSSPDNTGRYSLAIGEAESFPLNEIIRSLIALPQIKSQIFNKPAISAFLNIFGLFIWIPLLIILIIIIVSIWLLRKRKNK